MIHVQEAHRADHVDFGRELDGAEGPHCLEDSPGTDFAWLTYPLPGEYRVVKRRYSAFFGTDLEILLRGLHVDTLGLMVRAVKPDGRLDFTCLGGERPCWNVWATWWQTRCSQNTGWRGVPNGWQMGS